jgi:4-hydroxy-3-polyprenylbenzoate decarboxylase
MSPPPFADLGSFLDHRERQVAGTPNRSIFTSGHEIHRRVIAAGVRCYAAAPAGVPDDTAGRQSLRHDERVAAGLGTDAGGDLGKALAWLRSPRPPADLAEWRRVFPVIRAGLRARPRRVGGEPRLQDADADLGALPVQTCWPGDAGPLVTWPIVVTRPPGDDRFADYNLGVYRMQVLDDRSAILRWLPMRGGAAHHRAWAAAGQEIGADPAAMLATVMPAPGIGDRTLAGRHRRRPTFGDCPAGPSAARSRFAEIVLETVSATHTVEGR